MSLNIDNGRKYDVPNKDQNLVPYPQRINMICNHIQAKNKTIKDKGKANPIQLANVIPDSAPFLYLSNFLKHEI